MCARRRGCTRVFFTERLRHVACYAIEHFKSLLVWFFVGTSGVGLRRVHGRRATRVIFGLYRQSAFGRVETGASGHCEAFQYSTDFES